MNTEISEQLFNALEELHNLLEENLPNWYLKSHHVNAKTALDVYRTNAVKKQFYIICTKEYEFEGRIFKVGEMGMHCRERLIPENWRKATEQEVTNLFSVPKCENPHCVDGITGVNYGEVMYCDLCQK